MTSKELEAIRELIEGRFGKLEKRVEGFSRRAVEAVEHARKAADRALELAPRVAKLEERADDLEHRVKSLERGGVFEDDREEEPETVP